MAVIDVAFISLALVLNVVDTLLKPECGVIALIKPQFEAGRDKVGKGGIVRDAAVHKEVVQNIYEFLVLMGFEIKGLTYSPITGGSGNIEYLIYAGKGKNGQEKDIQSAIDYVIEESHRVFS